MTFAPLFQNASELVEMRRRLRRDATRAEQILWYELKGGKLGYKFRRQFSIGDVIADFCCSPLRLVVEVDGPVHDEAYQKDHDRRKDGWLRSQGYVVLRFKNDDVIFEKRNNVLAVITAWCEKLSKRNC